MSEVYATVWKRASQFDPERGSSIAWLSAIARNRSLDWRRSQRPMTNDELDQIEDDAPSALDAVIKQQQWQRVLKELAQLSAREREHLHAAFVDGKSYDALAKRDGIPLGTMKSWMRRALMRVRSAVEEQALGYRASRTVRHPVACSAEDRRPLLRPLPFGTSPADPGSFSERPLSHKELS